MYTSAKNRMIKQHLQARGIDDPSVLNAMRAVSRENFVLETLKDQAYADGALPLIKEQTISQPYIVALMTQLLQLKPEGRVLEIGSGSGYQAAVLAQIATEVHSVERIPELTEYAQLRLKNSEITNVQVHLGDGWNGWPDAAPYDGILVTAASEQIPKQLLHQLKIGARMIIPIGSTFGIQVLTELYRKSDQTIQQIKHIGVRFVPFISSEA